MDLALFLKGPHFETCFLRVGRICRRVLGETLKLVSSEGIWDPSGALTLGFLAHGITCSPRCLLCHNVLLSPGT